MNLINQNKTYKFAIIGDEDTVAGFLLTGIGEVDGSGEANYLIVNNQTNLSDIEDAYKNFTETRQDIAVVLINQYIAERIRHKLDAHNYYFPTVLEIPSKDKPYDITKDTIIQKIKKRLAGEN